MKKFQRNGPDYLKLEVLDGFIELLKKKDRRGVLMVLFFQLVHS